MMTSLLLAEFADAAVKVVMRLSRRPARSAATRMPIDVRLMVELDPHLRTALEVHVQRQMMPEEKAQQARHAEEQREGEEVPFLAKPIDINATKQFHEFPPIKNLIEMGRGLKHPASEGARLQPCHKATDKGCGFGS